ncbi:hypothetical protein SDC9_81064 [bioreactor metagenome]|uniref:Major facilitator superfamily (MFS) profile domain-containing protein n=1 Tax=bioreactor metagenome TaxID=1076179 RepID=A0A644Z3A4_9ZZZZ
MGFEVRQVQSTVSTMAEKNPNDAAIPWTPLFLSVGALQSGMIAAARVTFSIAALQVGASTFDAGFIVALMAIVPALTAIHFGRLMDRIGTHPVLMVSLSLSALVLLLSAFFQNTPSLLLAAPVVGACAILTHVANTRIMGAVQDIVLRTRNLGYIAAINSCAQLLAPAGAALVLEKHGIGIALLMLGFMPGLALLLMTMYSHKARVFSAQNPASGKTKPWDLLKIPKLRRVLLVNAVSSTSVTSFPFIAAVLGHDQNISPSQIGLLIASAGIGTVAIRLILPKIMKHVGTKTIMCASLAVTAAIYSLIPFFENIYILLMLAGIMGLFVGAGMPIALADIYSESPEGRVSETLGLTMSFSMIPQILVPMAVGGLALFIGLHFTILIFSAWISSAALYYWKTDAGK